MQMRCALCFFVAMSLVPAGARADRVHLVSGTMIEGNASRVGEKVFVDMPSGQLTLSAASVASIEESETDLERVQQRLEQLKPNDLQGMLKLASFCRDHDMRSRERELLLKVVALQPDHAEARARLGYVRGRDGSWITQDEQRREAGLVPYHGRFITEAELSEIERREAEAKLARIAREQAELELEAKKLELAQKRSERARAEQAKPEPSQPARVGSYPPYPVVYSVPVVGPSGTCVGGTCIPAGWKGPKPFPIPGVRDPRDMTFSIPGAQDPRSYY